MIRKIRISIVIIVLLAVAAAVAYFRPGASLYTIPALDGGLNALCNAVAFAFYCILLVLAVKTGRIHIGSAMLKALKIVIAAAILFAAGFLCRKYCGFGGKRWYVASSAASLLSLILFTLIYFRKRKRSGDAVSSVSIRRSATASGQIKYCYSVLYGALTAYVAYDAFNFAFCWPAGNPATFIPLAVVILALILWRILRWRGVLLIACAAVFFFVAMNFTPLWQDSPFGALVHFAVLLPLIDLYSRKEATI